MSHPLTVAELGALIQNEESIANEFAVGCTLILYTVHNNFV